MIKNLNEENKALHKQVKSITKERDDTQAKLLISEQIVINYKIISYKTTRHMRKI